MEEPGTLEGERRGQRLEIKIKEQVERVHQRAYRERRTRRS